MNNSFHISSHYFFLLLCTCFALGCSNKSTVTGNVTYPDGTPLTTGSVIFETESYRAYGIVDENGFYTLGEINPGDKIRPGTYKVKVMASSGGGSDGEPLVHHVDPKYANTATSGLTCNVQGKTVFNITVEKP
jgi:hypothetical protein